MSTHFILIWLFHVSYFWLACELLVTYSWVTCDFLVGYLWFTYGLLVTYFWVARYLLGLTWDLLVGYLWFTYGLLVTYFWVARYLLGLTWDLLVKYLCFTWDSPGTSLELTCGTVVSYYRDSLETYLGLTFDFIGILLELSWDTLMNYFWVSSVLSWGLLVLLVAFLWPRKTNQSFKFLVQIQSFQSAGHLYRTTTIIAINTFQVFTWLSQSTWEKCFCKDHAVVQIWSCASLPRHRWHGWPGVEGVKPTAKTYKKKQAKKYDFTYVTNMTKHQFRYIPKSI